jgi:transposase
MGQPLPLRPGYGAPGLRALARRSKDAPQSRRPLALAAIYDGGTRSEAARLGSVTLQIVRDWVLRFNAAGPEGLIDRKAPGQRPRLTGAHRAALAATIEAGPLPAVHGVVRWRLVDLGRWLSVGGVPGPGLEADAEPGAARHGLPQALGPAAASARPRHHARAEGAIEASKRTSPRRWRASRRRGAPAPRP